MDDITFYFSKSCISFSTSVLVFMHASIMQFICEMQKLIYFQLTHFVGKSVLTKRMCERLDKSYTL